MSFERNSWIIIKIFQICCGVNVYLKLNRPFFFAFLYRNCLFSDEWASTNVFFGSVADRLIGFRLFLVEFSVFQKKYFHFNYFLLFHRCVRFHGYLFSSS